jgi:hypothetical protein
VLSIFGASIDDLDGDGIDNDEDASSRDPAIKWAAAMATGYSMIEIEVPTGGNSYPVDINNESEVLFDSGKWTAGACTDLPDIENEGVYEPEEDSEIYYRSGITALSKLLPGGRVLAEVYYFTFDGRGGDFDLPHLAVINPDSSTITSPETVTWAEGSSRWGLTPLAADSSGRIFAGKSGVFTEPEIWILNSSLTKTGSYSLPSAYRPWDTLHRHRVG